MKCPEDETLHIISKHGMADCPDEFFPCLVVLQGRQLGNHYQLKAGGTVLGRTHDADLTIRDRSISRYHARFQTDTDTREVLLQDLGSMNGTYVNGHRIRIHQLRDGDKIMLGSTLVQFRVHDGVELELFRRLQRMLNIDELTGLVVKRRFSDEFELALAKALDEGWPLAVMMMDMDNLKAINDQYGHLAGAAAISQTGRIINEEITGKGLASRFGGDEFHAYLVNHAADDAFRVAQRIRAAVADHRFCRDEIRFRSSVSIGVAVAGVDGATVDQLIDAADRAMYAAKRAGRNRVCLAYPANG